jgi:phosphatidate cytidylyltransferase
VTEKTSDKNKNKNLVQRVVSAFILLPLCVWLVYRGSYWAAGLMSTAAGICAWEYYKITMGKLTPLGYAGAFGAFCLPMFPLIIPKHAGDLGFWWVIGFFILSYAYHLIRGPLKDAPVNTAHLTAGMIYGSSGMTALSFVRIRPEGLWWVVCAMVITWLNDTLAYFAGRFFGRHKMYPEVSPKKTWEGFAGGMVGSIGGLFFVRQFFFPALTVVDCLALGIGGGILGPIGDFCESMLKRAYGVKDSSQIIPGHGGLLDRIDALLFNGFLVFVYLQFARGFA